MNTFWSINLEILEEYYTLVRYLEKEYERPLTNEERELAFLRLMKSKNVKPLGHTELNKEEYIKEVVSKGKTVLNVDENGYKIIKPKEKNEQK